MVTWAGPTRAGISRAEQFNIVNSLLFQTFFCYFHFSLCHFLVSSYFHFLFSLFSLSLHCSLICFPWCWKSFSWITFSPSSHCHSCLSTGSDEFCKISWTVQLFTGWSQCLVGWDPKQEQSLISDATVVYSAAILVRDWSETNGDQWRSFIPTATAMSVPSSAAAESETVKRWRAKGFVWIASPGVTLRLLRTDTCRVPALCEVDVRSTRGCGGLEAFAREAVKNETSQKLRNCPGLVLFPGLSQFNLICPGLSGLVLRSHNAY